MPGWQDAEAGPRLANGAPRALSSGHSDDVAVSVWLRDLLLRLQVDLSCLRGALNGLGQLAMEEGSQRRISPTLDDILSLLGRAPAEGAAEAAEEFVRDVAGVPWLAKYQGTQWRY